MHTRIYTHCPLINYTEMTRYKFFPFLFLMLTSNSIWLLFSCRSFVFIFIITWIRYVFILFVFHFVRHIYWSFLFCSCLFQSRVIYFVVTSFERDFFYAHSLILLIVRVFNVWPNAFLVRDCTIQRVWFVTISII